MDDVVPPAPGVQGSVSGSVADHAADASTAVPPTAITAEGQTPTPPPAAPPSKRLRTQTGAAVASKEGRRSSSSGMQGGVGKLHSCIVKVRIDEDTIISGSGALALHSSISRIMN